MTAGKPKQNNHKCDSYDTFSRGNGFTAFTLITEATPSTLGGLICHQKTKQTTKGR